MYIHSNEERRPGGHMHLRRKLETTRVGSKEAAGSGAITALTKFLRADKFFFMVVLSLSFLPAIGCLESTFNLADDSRLPKWVTLPRGVTALGGDDAKVTLRDRRGKTIAEMRGKMKCHSSFASYPAYEVVVVNGISEVIEHKRMEPVFYITDDPAVKKMLFAEDRACE
jgi:hypothetical protein